MLLGLLFSSPLAFFLIVGTLILSVTIHEFCHALAADRLGDPTPRVQDRLTLNPLRHLDPVGTIALLLFGFGWGRPVIFDPHNLRSPRRDAALIAAAGPASNILIALLVSILFPLFFPLEITVFIVRLNVILALFNLIPIHPLDGGKVLSAFLPKEYAYEFDRALNQYGFIILLLLIFPWAGGEAPISFLLDGVQNQISNAFFQAGSIIRNFF